MAKREPQETKGHRLQAVRASVPVLEALLRRQMDRASRTAARLCEARAAEHPAGYPKKDAGGAA